MVGPVDLSHIIARIQIAEKVQDVMDRNAELRQVYMTEEFVEEQKNRTKSVNEVAKSENTVIERERKKEQERKRRERRKKQEAEAAEAEGETPPGSNIDVEV